MMFGKHFASTYTGSMVGAGADIFAVWGYVIAHTVQSQVELNPDHMALVLGMKPDAVAKAIACLCAPDPKSRNPSDKGRRLVFERAFSYRVPSHELYRGLRNEDERREYFRVKKAEQRQRDRTKVNKSKRKVKLSTHTEAEAEAEAEKTTKTTSTRRIATAADSLFEVTWSQYPKRAGSNPKRDALHAWRARIGEQVSPDEMAAGVQRYRAYCEHAGKAGTEYVMQARRFFGPSHPFAESWEFANGNGRPTPQHYTYTPSEKGPEL